MSRCRCCGTAIGPQTIHSSTSGGAVLTCTCLVGFVCWPGVCASFFFDGCDERLAITRAAGAVVHASNSERFGLAANHARILFRAVCP